MNIRKKLQEHINLNTPTEELSVIWHPEREVQVFVKRDDLIHPLISGNKLRKLEGIFENNPEPKSVVSFGGAYSNHLIALAMLCYYLKIPVTGVIRGEELSADNDVLKSCERLGMKLVFIPRSDYKEQCRTYSFKDGVLTIPEGGHCVDGTIGLKRLAEELDTDYAVISCGTGTSVAGLSKGFKGKTIGVSALKGGDFIQQEARAVGADRFDLWTEYHFGGFAKTNDTLIRATEFLFDKTGILFDPVYTAKAMYGLTAKIDYGYFEPGSTITFIHTGGLSGWWGMQENKVKKKADNLITGFLNNL
ncbi:pyridoxal-phosphate dependent enzyme [bacterium]|nr:pyridoxal-phosphate dependent enzyme [bacterium]